jgi:hypothetical protein
MYQFTALVSLLAILFYFFNAKKHRCSGSAFCRQSPGPRKNGVQSWTLSAGGNTVCHICSPRALREGDTLIVWKLDRHRTCDSGAHPQSTPASPR